MVNDDQARRRSLRTFHADESPWQLREDAQHAGGALIDLASNDYLGLSRHPTLVNAATAALHQDGVGAGGSRLVTGSRPCHARLEQALADWLGRERVLLFPSGFQANLAAVQALADRHSTVLADRLIHHSLLIGIRACGARLQRFAHNDLSDLEQRLQKLRRADSRSVLVITESLFSMEGTSPDLEVMAALCSGYGARLLVDEAHALGVLGTEGRGLCHGLKNPVHLISGTFGKAFGSGGAFLAGDAAMGDRLLQTSGAFRYTTALAPPLVAGATAALDLIKNHPDWGMVLQQRSAQWRRSLLEKGWQGPDGTGPILPLLIGSDQEALDCQHQLERAGLLCMAIRPPTVPEGTARLRLVLRRDLPDETLNRLIEALPSR